MLAALAALAGAAPKHHQTRDRAYRSRKRECEGPGSPCHGREADAAANCVNECVSPACYGAVYAAEPLEDGEVDSTRSRTFLACVRKEAAAESSAGRAERKAERKRRARGEEA